MRETITVRVTVDREWFRWSDESDVRSKIAGLVYSAIAHENDTRASELNSVQSVLVARVEEK